VEQRESGVAAYGQKTTLVITKSSGPRLPPLTSRSFALRDRSQLLYQMAYSHRLMPAQWTRGYESGTTRKWRGRVQTKDQAKRLV